MWGSCSAWLSHLRRILRGGMKPWLGPGPGVCCGWIAQCLAEESSKQCPRPHVDVCHTLFPSLICLTITSTQVFTCHPQQWQWTLRGTRGLSIGQWTPAHACHTTHGPESLPQSHLCWPGELSGKGPFSLLAVLLHLCHVLPVQSSPVSIWAVLWQWGHSGYCGKGFSG